MHTRRTYSALGFIVLTMILVCAQNASVAATLRALWSGSLGSWYSLTSATLVRATPLMLAGCAVAIAFRGGVLNIGAEGQLLLGATGAALVSLAFPAGGIATILLALVVGSLLGAFWSGIAAVLQRAFGVLEVISTIMLNFVALYLVSYLVRGPLQEPTHAYPQSSSLVESVRLWQFPGAGRLHVGLVIAFVALAIAGWVLRYTAGGFRVVAVGENPRAAASAGLIDVRHLRFDVMLYSGALAGLAGAVEVLGVTFALYEDISPGYGYTAIGVALLAGLDPWRAALSAFLFAAIEAGAGAMQRDAGVPSTVAAVVEALIILGILALKGGSWSVRRAVRSNTAAPAAP